MLLLKQFQQYLRFKLSVDSGGKGDNWLSEKKKKRKRDSTQVPNTKRGERKNT